jgi:AcrR family transcriptional regulator
MLRDAVFALLDEKSFDAISVREITRRAGLNAATFYLHYADKWDLITSVATELSEIARREAHNAFVFEERAQGRTNLLERALFAHIEQHFAFYKLMFGRNGVAPVRHELRNQFQQVVRMVLAQLPATFDTIDVPDELVEHYFAGAYLAVIEWWLQSREPVPAEQLARWTETLWRTTLASEFAALYRTVVPEGA